MLFLTWSLALYPYRYIYLLTWCHTNRPMTTKPTYNNYNTAHLRRRGYGCPPPLSLLRPPPLLSLRSWCDLWPVTLAGAEAAEWQRDEGTMCEGRRGGSPDLSEWRRPAREMYTLPLLLLLYSYIVTFLPISTSTQQTHTGEGRRSWSWCWWWWWRCRRMVSPFAGTGKGEGMSNMSLVAPLFILFSGVGLFVLLYRRIMTFLIPNCKVLRFSFSTSP